MINLRDDDYIILSPYCSNYSKNENEQRIFQLKNEIKKLGYGFIEIIALWTKCESEERSLVIFNAPKDILIKVAEKYNLPSITIKEGLICNEVGINNKMNDVLRSFTFSTSKSFNIIDAQKIFPSHNTTLSELYEVINTHNVATFSEQERVQRIF